MSQVIALAGVGNLGKYVFEQLTADARYEVIVLSRKPSQWLVDNKADVQTTDYSENSLLSILDGRKCTAIVSFINANGELYDQLHSALLNACEKSQTCKRMIPSEWIGNIEDYPLLPRFYGETREPFRAKLRESSIEWTLFNGGWLMDYLVPMKQTYMKPIPEEFPIDPNGWKACIRGTGDEPQSFTLARDIACAVVELLEAPKWEPVTYVTGEFNSFNGALKIMEDFKGKKIEISPAKSVEEINALVSTYQGGELTHDMEIILVDEWMVVGAAACPEQKTLEQREKFFKTTEFSSIRDMLEKAETGVFI